MNDGHFIDDPLYIQFVEPNFDGMGMDPEKVEQLYSQSVEPNFDELGMKPEKTNNHGGARPGSGRKATGRNVPLMVRISQEASEKLVALNVNKSEFIDKLIKKYKG